MDPNVPLRSPLGVPYRSPLGVLAKSGSFQPIPTTVTVPCSVFWRQTTKQFQDAGAPLNQGIQVFGLGNDIGNQFFDFGSFTITDTVSYNGTYQTGPTAGGTGIRSQNGVWTFRGGDLGSVTFAGDEPGNWNLITGEHQGPITCIGRQAVHSCDAGNPNYPFTAAGDIELWFTWLRRPLKAADFPIMILNPDGSDWFEIPIMSACTVSTWLNGRQIITADLALDNNATNAFSPFVQSEIVHEVHMGNRLEQTGLPAGNLVGFRAQAAPELFPLAPWLACFDYSAIANGPLNTYPALAQGVGFNTADTLLRFSNITPYNGDHQINHIDATTVRLINRLWEGDATNGNWINNNAAFTANADMPSSPLEASVRNSSIPAYDGLHTFVSDGANIWIAQNLFFEGTATGEIVMPGAPGIDVFGTGPSGFGSGAMNLRISGTSSYNGDYACNYANIGTNWSFTGGDLALVAFVGDETGTWLNIDNPAETGPIIAIQATNPETVYPFTVVAAERSGTISAIISSVMRVTATGHTAAANDQGRLFSTGAIYDDRYRLIRGVATDLIDIDGLFVATDTGRITILPA